MDAVETTAGQCKTTVDDIKARIIGSSTANIVLGNQDPGGTNNTVISSNASLGRTYMKWTDKSLSAVQSVGTAMSSDAINTMWASSMAFTYARNPNRLVSTIKYGSPSRVFFVEKHERGPQQSESMTLQLADASEFIAQSDLKPLNDKLQNLDGSNANGNVVVGNYTHAVLCEMPACQCTHRNEQRHHRRRGCR